MMKKITLILMTLLVYCHQNTLAQCYNNINTVTTDWRVPTSKNKWDWTSSFFDAYITNGGQIQIKSPFRIESGNSLGDNPNLQKFYDAYSNFGLNGIDYLPEEGWELLIKNFGTQAAPTDNPVFALYNRYTGVIRVFAMITTSTPFNGAVIELQLMDGKRKTALLSHTNNILNPLVNFNPTVLFQVPNYYATQSRFWLTGDFVTFYDPCTCNKPNEDSQIKIDVRLVQKSQISLSGTLIGTIKEVIKNNQPESDLQYQPAISNLNDVKNIAQSGIKSYKTWEGYKSETQKFLNAESTKSTFKKVFNVGNTNLLTSIGKIANILPYVGAFSGLVDFFVGGGTKDASTQRPPLNFEISQKFNASGEIKLVNNYLPLTFYVPGSKPNAVALKPYYDNILGVISILEMPVLEKIYAYNPNPYPDYTLATKSATNYINPPSKIYQYKVKNELKYAINPASNLKLKKLEAAIVLEYKADTPKFNYLENNAYDQPYASSNPSYSGLKGFLLKNYLTPVQVPGKWINGITNEFEDRLSNNGIEIDSWPQNWDAVSDTNKSFVRLRTRYLPVDYFKQTTFLLEGDDNPNFVKIMPKFYCKIIATFEVIGKPDIDPIVIVQTYPVDLQTASTYSVGSFDWGVYTPADEDRAYTYVKNYYTFNYSTNNVVSPLIFSDSPKEIVLLKSLLPKTDPISGNPFNFFSNGNETRSAWDKITIGSNINLLPGTTLDLTAPEILMLPNDYAYPENVILTAGLPIMKTNDVLPQNGDLAQWCNSTSYLNSAKPSISNKDNDDLLIADMGINKDSLSANNLLNENSFLAYPNPTNGEVTIAYTLQEAGMVTLWLSNQNGRIIQFLVQEGSQSAGSHSITIDTQNLPAGTYFYTLQTGDFQETKRLLIVK